MKFSSVSSNVVELFDPVAAAFSPAVEVPIERFAELVETDVVRWVRYPEGTIRQVGRSRGFSESTSHTGFFNYCDPAGEFRAAVVGYMSGATFRFASGAVVTVEAFTDREKRVDSLLTGAEFVELVDVVTGLPS
jgi:hypothetical protein